MLKSEIFVMFYMMKAYLNVKFLMKVEIIMVKFLHDSNSCVLNIRVKDNLDGYTCVSTKGKSVVDYIITQNVSFDKFKSFKILQVNDLVQKYDLCKYLSSSSKVSDHAVLYTEILTTSHEINCGLVKNINNLCLKRRIYDFDNIPSNFCLSNLCLQQMNNMFEKLEYNCMDINEAYSIFCDVIKKEMYSKIPFIDKNVNKSGMSKTVNRKRKSFWDIELTKIWNNMKLKEKEFIRFSGNYKDKSKYRQNYLLARSEFDKMLRKKERIHNNDTLLAIEYSSKNNPKEFWNKINMLGPKYNNKQTAYFSVMIDDIIYTDENVIRQKWLKDFQTLYQGAPYEIGEKAKQWLNYAKNKIKEQDMLMKSENHKINSFLNYPISHYELTHSINKLKNKAAGYDCLPNEILKCKNVFQFLYTFFYYCFENCVVPEEWGKAIISPILKAGKKSYEPLNFRGISILSCVGKLYSSIMESRITNYCETFNLVADQQNGFRAGRSCSDHIFVITSIIRNRLSFGEYTFCALIDMEKAFNWVRRDLLFYCLLNSNINGKIFNAIRSLYKNTTAYVRLNSMLNTDWFPVQNGVKQGDPLSAKLFCLFINSLVDHLNQLGIGGGYIYIGVDINGTIILCTLLYADDIILIAKSEAELQSLLLALEEWCNLWQLYVNVDKTKIYTLDIQGKNYQLLNLFLMDKSWKRFPVINTWVFILMNI